MTQTFVTQVKSALKMVPQPDELTCQSACIAMAIGSKDVMGIRDRLVRRGTAGDPGNMGRLLTEELGDRYEFEPNASLNDAREALKKGAFCITHGWFTDYGHVIALDGVEIDPKNLSYRFNVKDPWSEFDFKSWSYPYSTVGFDGYYSSYGIYAACVVSQSRSHAANIYRRRELDSSRSGMWLHIIHP